MEDLSWTNYNGQIQIANVTRMHATQMQTSADGYDLDLNDFTAINVKKQCNEHVTRDENNRYGEYVMTVIEIALEGPKFKQKTKTEKSELREQMYFELLQGILSFDMSRGSSIFSYAYRIAYTAACHYYNNKIRDYRNEQKLKESSERCQKIVSELLFNYKTQTS